MQAMRWVVALIGVGLALAGFGLPGTVARANGNYSHVWVAGDALTDLPEGDVRAALQDAHLVNLVRAGAMYPDGGYAISDGYGEISHWEPFHLAYLEWIRATYQPPWSAEALEHIAFLFGIVAHGLTDQMYDGMYLERYKVYDHDGCASLPYGTDGVTDACFAADMGPMDKPAIWVPADVLAPLYEPLGHHVDAETIRKGTNLVPFAIVHALSEANDAAAMADVRAACPWACGHQDDPTVPGSPASCGPAIAAYWQVLWGLLNGHQGFDQPILAPFFSGGSPWDYPVDASNPESWVSFMMPRGLDASTVTSATVVVTSDGGGVVPAAVDVYYGTDSHLVNVRPQADWPASATFTLTASPPIATWNGLTLAAPLSFQFSTLPRPVVAEPDAAEVVEPTAESFEVAEPAPEPVELVEPAPDAVEASEVAADAPPPADVVADASSDGSGSGSGGCAAVDRAPASGGAVWWLGVVLIALLAAPVGGRRRA